MKTLPVYKNILLRDFLENKEVNAIEHMIADEPKGNGEMLLYFANIISKRSNRIGMEIKIDGLQRSKRIPLVFSKNNDVFIAKYNSDSSKMEQSIMTLDDLVTGSEKAIDSKFKITGVLVHDSDSIHPRLDELARSLQINLVHKGDIDGLLN